MEKTLIGGNVPDSIVCMKMFEIIDLYMATHHSTGWTWNGAIEFIQKHWSDSEYNNREYYENILRDEMNNYES